jgi:hypothetical protein
MRSLFVILLIALAANPTVSARARHRAPKAAAAPSAATTSAAPADAKPQNTPEKDRDPADVALDRKIKGICRGC